MDYLVILDVRRVVADFRYDKVHSNRGIGINQAGESLPCIELSSWNRVPERHVMTYLLLNKCTFTHDPSIVHNMT